MSLSAGTKLGPYELVSLVGSGGMGEVYKARDMRLDRIVAIKLLHADLSERPERRARFAIEASAISALNHPHICTLFDVGDASGRAFLVMEFLDGETLSDRLTRGALPIVDVLRYASEIADALDHAHRQGVVHRDIKPSNVLLTASGAKLLDFGLAKRALLEGDDPGVTESMDRTITADGTLIGTVQYMAPEQLEGKAVDARTDVFAFGMLLYEMTTGRKAFLGDSRASLIAAILTAQPASITVARPVDHGKSPAALDHIVQRCLAKQPAERWQTARDLMLELRWLSSGSDPKVESVGQTVSRRAMRWLGALALTIGAAAVAGAAGAWLVAPRSATEAITRFIIESPPGTSIGVPENRTRIAMSPNGRQLAMVVFSEGQSQIWVRGLDSVAPQALLNTDGGMSPFWSPDGQFIGFFSPRDGQLKKVAVSGGPALPICDAELEGTAVWGPDGTILFTRYREGIYRVSAEGGVAARVTTLNKTRHELNHYWPQFLPDGRHFFYMATALDGNGLRATPTIYVASLDAPGATQIVQKHSRVVYTEPGYLLFVEDGTLMAQAFDRQNLELTGEPVRIADDIAYYRTLGNGGFSVSGNGVLAYQGSGNPLSLVWYDRRGQTIDRAWPPRNFGLFRLSPGGDRLAAEVVDPHPGTADIWIYEASRDASVRLTTDLMNESRPVWSPDGQQLLFRADRAGSPDLYEKNIGTGAESMIVNDTDPLSPDDWSSDGRLIAYTVNTRQTGRDLWFKPVSTGGRPQAFSATRFDEWGASFSPDAQSVAFVSDETGSPEVFVAPVQAPGSKKRISIGGGTAPRWRQDGRELYYASADNRTVMTVTLESRWPFNAGLPTPLFSVGVKTPADEQSGTMLYDVSPDGQRFVVALPAGPPASSRVTVVLNWTAALPR